ncbi:MULTISPECIES: leucine-rich repeat-containing protein kinase family protein [unclassified Variovorax]|uniref:leucine-rich repeat-containing protein kinase family protein n=1 Tax=unclassified Variovorax TaxID=663243 RepID=UPI002576A1BD|nr:MULTISPECIES: leucine-rich repeat-containing protein kinase family protein [unclassified Variovorax]MDM0091698.1 leucine-rich repeat-containing protein kinase family protein [Variovorax sp. J22G40]MDM0149779.1 leucine-rich repeat-containing protein kinase family protein [Variovorax sp. J2P1-31]
MNDTLSRLRDGQRRGATRLALREGLTEFPREVFALADTLEILDLSGNALDALPDDLHRLHRLRVLFCSDNRFTVLPESLGRCAQLEMVGFKANRIAEVPASSLPPRLRWLILSDNAIEELPDALGQRHRLQKLMLAGNRLRALPATLAGCERLELLRIAANRFDTLPPWLTRMPRLSWLAFGGNPLNAVREAAVLAAPPLPAIGWRALEVHEVVGEGASGLIHRATWTEAPGGARQVALKLFKGALTSDGAPQSELAASLAAGPHPHRIGAEGRLSGHPDGTEGLVMPWADTSFAVLAGPPSFDSCTRDVYAVGTRFAPEAALRLARGIAGAVADLHARGLLHGDLYGHNILWRADGEARLGDLGAASFLSDDADALQGLEARAFGCLAEELLHHSDPAAPLLAPLAAVAARCLQPAPAARPSFDEIARALAGTLATAPAAR